MAYSAIATSVVLAVVIVGGGYAANRVHEELTGRGCLGTFLVALACILGALGLLVGTAMLLT